MGRIHSYETFGAADGPGIRFVVFLQGCPLRCLYCHNPDAISPNGGFELNASDVVEKIKRYKHFIKDGGVTISGGEPLYQSEFTAQILRLCKKEGFHTAIDTAGYIKSPVAKEAILLSSLILLDIKEIDKNDAKILTGQDNSLAFKTLKFCEQNKKSVWIRHVLVPGYTLNEGKLKRLADYLKGFECVERIEFLPFHKLGEYKYKELGLDFKLKRVSEPSRQEVERTVQMFKRMGFNAV